MGLFRSGITHKYSITSSATAPQSQGSHSVLQTCSNQCFLWYQAMQNTIDKRGKVSAGSLGEETILFSLQKKTKTPAGHHRCLSIGSLGGAEKPTTFPNYHTSIRKKVSDFSGEKHHFFVFYITFFCVRKYAIIVEKKEDTL